MRFTSFKKTLYNIRNIKFKKFKTLQSNWFITFSSTIMGVVLGLIINDYYNANIKLKNKEIALELVQKEIDDNEKLLVEYNRHIETLASNFKIILDSYVNDKVFIHKDSLENYKEKMEFFKISKIKSKNDSLEIQYSILIKYNPNNLITGKLSSIAWETYKNSGHLELTDFNEASRIEKRYNSYKNFTDLNNEWQKIYQNPKDLIGKESFNSAISILDKLKVNMKLLQSRKHKN